MVRSTQKTLWLKFHGRIIDHLGIQMYHSPVASVAELLANAWDADARKVEIMLPDELDASAVIIVKDDGLGMTFEECQDHYLNVGWCRRGDDLDEHSPKCGRPIIGRKGIGKLAGFGIADLVKVETISEENGEKTVFELDINRVRGDEREYVGIGDREITVVQYDGPNKNRTKSHGTKITLSQLKLKRCPSPERFSTSMGRRFLLHQQAADFRVFINGSPLGPSEDSQEIEFEFPRDYKSKEQPEGLSLDSGWGLESLPNSEKIKWRIAFYRSPIGEEELRGITVFSRGKLGQLPFFFNLAGGLGGQHGLEYMSGQIQADYIDLLDEDIIATERQRINWEHPAATPLESWGQDRIKQLLRIWRDRRGEKRRRQIEQKVAGFSKRLEKLPPHERRTVKSALNKLGAVSTLSDPQFQELGGAILQAWEQGRLRALIDAFATSEQITADSLLSLLMEADVLVALNLAEAVKTKLEAIRGLRTLVQAGELEAAVRDYIAEKPYLLDSKWETFRKETSVKHILDEAAAESALALDEGEENQHERKRIDLALRSGEHLLVVEFMRPGKTADYEHLSRCRAYIYLVREKTEAESALGIEKVTGLIVADRLDRKALVRREVQDLKEIDIHAFSWETLLGEAERTWKDFLEVLEFRAPEDERLRSLQDRQRSNDR